MANPSDILKDPNFVNANAATKQAIFDKHIATDKAYTTANPATQAAIRVKFGLMTDRPEPKAEPQSGMGLPAAKVIAGIVNVAKNPSLPMVPESAKKAAIGLGETGAQMITGAVARPLGDIAGLVDIPLHASGISKIMPEDVKSGIQSALTYQPRTADGKAIATSKYNPLNILASTTEKVAQSAKRAVGGGALGDGVAEAIRQGVGLIGVKGAVKIPPEIAASNVVKQGIQDTLRQTRQYEDALVHRAKSAGFVFAPSEVPTNSVPGALARAGEAVSGLHVFHLGAETNQLHDMASVRNQLTAENLARGDLKLPDGNPVPATMPLHKDTLEAFRKDHGKVYQQVADVKGRIPYSQTYVDEVKSLNSDLADAERQYPDLIKDKDIQLIKRSLIKGGSTTAPAAVQIMRDLRFKSEHNFRSEDAKTIAKAKIERAGAAAVENLLDEHLANMGNSALMNKFRNSRQNIAKSYAIESALGKGNHLSAKELAKSEAPLSGGLALVRDMAINHPKVMSDVEYLRSHTGGSAADYIVGAGASTWNPALGAAIASRPMIRHALLSETGQKAIQTPTYGISAIRKAAPIMVKVGGRLMALTPAQIDMLNRMANGEKSR